MSDNPDWPRKAYKNDKFLNSKDARGLRILSEYMEPEARFEEFQVRDTVVFFGSARFVSRDEAEKRLKAAQDQDSDVTAAECDLDMSAYYEAARELAGRLTEWSKAQGLPGSMNSVFTPILPSQALTTLAVSSGPLSERM